MLKLHHLFLDNIRMLFERALRWLFLKGDRWVNIQVMINEVGIHPGSFISILGKHINVLSKESNQLFILPRRQLNSHLKELIIIIIIINGDLFLLFTSRPLIWSV